MKNIILPAALLFATSAAFAQDMPSFTDLDTDADGMLSLDEASAVEGLDFTTADADSDGAISLDEFVAATQG